MKIYFEDRGQDFLEWTINKKGFVTKSEPFQTWVWKGTKVIIPSIKVGMKPKIILKSDLPNKDITELNYDVIKIRK